jgi:hypothetical protein
VSTKVAQAPLSSDFRANHLCALEARVNEATLVGNGLPYKRCLWALCLGGHGPERARAIARNEPRYKQRFSASLGYEFDPVAGEATKRDVGPHRAELFEWIVLLSRGEQRGHGMDGDLICKDRNLAKAMTLNQLHPVEKTCKSDQYR